MTATITGLRMRSICAVNACPRRASAAPSTALSKRAQLADVGARGERALAGAGEDDGADAVVRVESAKTPASSAIIATLSALRTFGRLRVTIATASSRSTETCS